jgi:hypothetical protein
MNKVIIILATALSLLSCEKEEVSKVPLAKNCDCYRIVKIVEYSVIGTSENPQTTNHATIYTINDCTNWNEWYEWKSVGRKYPQNIGDCYNN